MWINPNPYFLHQTKFNVIPKQIFLIQSFAFFDTIQPIIRKILENNGFGLKYFTDQNGQVVFEDIWVLMNTCQAIIVDFTDKRPNVYLEYGMALVLGKPIVAIAQDIADLPSNTLNLKSIIYQDKKIDSNLEKKLIPAIEQTIKDIDEINSQSNNQFPSIFEAAG